MSKQNLWSQAAASLEKACEDEQLAAKWKESFANLSKNQQNESRIERLPARDAARLILHSLGRGHGLIKQAEEWKEPNIGSMKRSSQLNQTRGVMWRYVMAYCGWEQCTKSLGLTQNTQNIILTADQKLSPPILSQSQIKQIQKWLPEFNEVEDQPSDANETRVTLDSFLDLRNQYKMFPYWLLGSKEQVNLTDAAVLAILRNICVHGSLSPTKANDWGLTCLYRDGTTYILEGFIRLLSMVYPTN